MAWGSAWLQLFCSKVVLPNIKSRVSIILLMPFLFIFWFKRIYLVLNQKQRFCNINSEIKNCGDQIILSISTYFWRKLWVIWKKCKGANICGHDWTWSMCHCTAWRVTFCLCVILPLDILLYCPLLLQADIFSMLTPQ